MKFVGFEECLEGDPSDAILVFSNSEMGTGYADQFSKHDAIRVIKIGVDQSQFTYFSEADVLKIKSTLIHEEFGHLAGLEHEHQFYRKAAFKDPNCLIPNASGKSVVQWILETKQFARMGGKSGAWGMLGRIAPYYAAFKRGKKHFGKYDSHSIMNYCNVLKHPGSDLICAGCPNFKVMYQL